MEDCPICFESLDLQGLNIHTTACNHQFHAKCLSRAILMCSPCCPCCRAVIDKPIVIKDTKALSKLIRREKIETDKLSNMMSDKFCQTIDKIIQNEKIISIRRLIAMEDMEMEEEN
jgi:hypothetical protein